MSELSHQFHARLQEIASSIAIAVKYANLIWNWYGNHRNDIADISASLDYFSVLDTQKRRLKIFFFFSSCFFFSFDEISSKERSLVFFWILHFLGFWIATRVSQIKSLLFAFLDLFLCFVIVKRLRDEEGLPDWWWWIVMEIEI